MDLVSVLERVPLWRGTPTEVTPLGGGITNRNYLVRAHGAAYVLRVSGDNTAQLGIDRAVEVAAARAAAEEGLGPEVVYVIEPEGWLVTRYIAGRPIAPGAMREPAMLARVCDPLRRLHQLPGVPAVFTPWQVIEDYHRLVLAHLAGNGAGENPLPRNFDWYLDQTRRMAAALTRPPRLPDFTCHNDLLNENFLLEDGTGRVVILDWEYAGMGDPWFDLGNFAAHHGFDEAEDGRLIEIYFRDEASPRRLARLWLMKCLSDLREAMWGAAQCGLSTLDFDFRGYAQKFFDRAAGRLRDPRFPRWLELA
jgi:thiamine kinase-like enzyme